MKKLGEVLASSTRSLGSQDESSRIARRVAEVHLMFREAIEYVYGASASYVLSHVNAVYIKKEDNGKKCLSVYMDDGNFRADVHSQQHFIILLLHERFGEEIDEFKAYPSRMGMKDRHPYAEYLANVTGKREEKSVPVISPAQRFEVNEWAEKIEDPALRERFISAASTDIAWKNEE